MYLARDVMDKQILDRDGFSAGKVDDLVLELRDGQFPVVRSIKTQHGALAAHLGELLTRAYLQLRRAILGLDPDVLPVQIEWRHVTAIDVTVHVDIDRHQAGLLRSEEAVWDRLISRLPFARRRAT